MKTQMTRQQSNLFKTICRGDMVRVKYEGFLEDLAPNVKPTSSMLTYLVSLGFVSVTEKAGKHWLEVTDLGKDFHSPVVCNEY